MRTHVLPEWGGVALSGVANADRRLAHNPADHVRLPTEEPGEQRHLSADEVGTPTTPQVHPDDWDSWRPN